MSESLVEGSMGERPAASSRRMAGAVAFAEPAHHRGGMLVPGEVVIEG